MKFRSAVFCLSHLLFAINGVFAKVGNHVYTEFSVYVYPVSRVFSFLKQPNANSKANLLTSRILWTVKWSGQHWSLHHRRCWFQETNHANYYWFELKLNFVTNINPFWTAVFGGKRYRLGSLNCSKRLDSAKKVKAPARRRCLLYQRFLKYVELLKSFSRCSASRQLYSSP